MIYTTSPVKALTGVAKIQDVQRLKLQRSGRSTKRNSVFERTISISVPCEIAGSRTGVSYLVLPIKLTRLSDFSVHHECRGRRTRYPTQSL